MSRAWLYLILVNAKSHMFYFQLLFTNAAQYNATQHNMSMNQSHMDNQIDMWPRTVRADGLCE